MAITGFGDIAERLRRSTVLVQAAGRGVGSGVIWSNDGVIITNAHVARGAIINVQLWDGSAYPARIISRDIARDLAQLRIEPARAPAAALGDSSRVRPGELAIAIGNPLGFVGALTTGVIHRVGAIRHFGPRVWVQADVRLAPGNSGGPLADAMGRVIGINTMVAGGLALAVPSNVVREFLSTGPSYAWLGVTVRPVRIPGGAMAGSAQGRFGLLLLDVEVGSPAATSSLATGDILLGTDLQPFSSANDLLRVLQGTGLRTLRFEFLRGDYSKVRRVGVLLGGQTSALNSAAA